MDTPVPFNTQAITQTQFAVALSRGEELLYDVPVALEVKEELAKMLQETLTNLGDCNSWLQYECAEQYPTTTSLTIPINDPLTVKIKQLYESENISTAADALSKPSLVSFYLARFTDVDNNECMAVRRASYFRSSIGKSFLYWLENQLRVVEGELFRLDVDFDFIIFENQVAIYRPTNFEYVADFESEVVKLIPSFIQAIAVAVPFLDLDFAVATAEKSSRARKLLAGIKSRTDLSKISLEKFKAACLANGIAVTENNGKLSADANHEVALLELIDRRRYNDPLVDDEPDAYRASARSRMPK